MMVMMAMIMMVMIMMVIMMVMMVIGDYNYQIHEWELWFHICCKKRRQQSVFLIVVVVLLRTFLLNKMASEMHVAPQIVVHCCPLLSIVVYSIDSIVIHCCLLLLSTADIIDCLQMALSLELVKYCYIQRVWMGWDGYGNPCKYPF